MNSTGDTSPDDSAADRTRPDASPAWPCARGPVGPPPDTAVAGAPPRPVEEALHELRATVVGLELASQLLEARDVEMPPARRRRLQRMHDSETARLKRLLGGGRQTLVAVDLDEVVSPLVEGLRLRGHDIHWLHLHSHALGRPDDIAEIVHILLENAVRHAPGTTVTIEPAAPVPGWTGIRVHDRGAGVAAGTRPLLFVRGGRRPGSPGLGLGLHIAQRLAREMGGSLVLEPASCAAGASFRLTLPGDLVHATGA